MKLKNKLIISLLLFLNYSVCSAQSCRLVKMGESSPTLADSSKLVGLNTQISSDTTGAYYILLVREAGELPNSSVFFLRGKQDKYDFQYIKNGLVVKKKNVFDSDLKRSLEGFNPLRGYFMGECNNNKWSHIGERLLIINNKKNISLEIFSYNEDLKDILKSDSRSENLVYLYDLAINLAKGK